MWSADQQVGSLCVCIIVYAVKSWDVGIWLVGMKSVGKWGMEVVYGTSLETDSSFSTGKTQEAWSGG